MHQEAADKLSAAEGDLPFGSPGFFPLAEKITSVFVTERIRLFEMATRWV